MRSARDLCALVDPAPSMLLLEDMSDAFPPRLKLHHRVPGWVASGSTFHIRIRAIPMPTGVAALTEATIGAALLKSVKHYNQRQRWWCSLFLLMPDHLHALLSFPKELAMSRIIGEWKHFHAVQTRVSWQDGYFDHRIRNAREHDLKAGYIRQNPVVKGLCKHAADWPWVWEPARTIDA
ncbi:MAG: transposase [Cephaloticoccus sp.]|nr:transposase [Cephaloticoccus sp.]